MSNGAKIFLTSNLINDIIYLSQMGQFDLSFYL